MRSNKRKQAWQGLIRRMVDLLAIETSGQVQCILDRHWRHCADWLLKSLRGSAGGAAAKEYFLARDAEAHLFLTAYIPHPSLASQISGDGVRVEGSLFTVPRGWTLEKKSSRCSFLDKTLPAVVVKLESEEKGNGLFAGQEIGPKELVCVYIGEHVKDKGTRPLSRMVVHQTSSAGSEGWAYCYGMEDLSRCIAICAVGPCANAPSRGEATNCSLDRNQWALFKDEKGIRMLAFPIASNRTLANGEAVLWAYDPEAASGRNFATVTTVA
jgi:hypothetical protein